MISDKQKQKAAKLLEDSYGRRQMMPEFSSEALSRKYGIGVSSVRRFAAGETPKTGLSSQKVRRLRIDIARRQELISGYKSLDQIAEDVGVSRTLVRKWARDFGLAETGKRKKPAPAKPVKLDWVGTPMGRFAVMRLSRSPASRVCYY